MGYKKEIIHFSFIFGAFAVFILLVSALYSYSFPQDKLQANIFDGYGQSDCTLPVGVSNSIAIGEPNPSGVHVAAAPAPLTNQVPLPPQYAGGAASVVVTESAPACITNISLCSSLSPAGACLSFLENISLMNLESFEVSYVEIQYADGNAEIGLLSDYPEIDVEVVNNNAQVSAVDNVFTPQTIGSFSLRARMANDSGKNMFAQDGLYAINNTEIYGDVSNFIVDGLQCSGESSRIYSSNIPFHLAQVENNILPEPATFLYQHILNQEFKISGQTLSEKSYEYYFRRKTTNQDSAEVSTRQFLVFYSGSTLEEQRQSIIDAYNSLSFTDVRSLSLSSFLDNGIMKTEFRTLELGNDGDLLKNVWSISMNNTITDFMPATGRVFYSPSYFPETLVKGESYVAYFPGGSLHGKWSLNNEVLSLQSYSSSSVDLADDYDNPFIVVKAIQEGNAILSVSGQSCMTGMSVQVVADEITFFVEGEELETNILSATVGEVFDMTVKTKNGTVVSLENQEWYFLKDENGGDPGVATLLESGEHKSNVLSIQQKGRTFIKVYVTLSSGEKISRVLQVRVVDGIELNGKSSQEQYVDVFVGDSQIFTFNGSSEPEWKLSDIISGSMSPKINDDGTLSKTEYVYKAPSADSIGARIILESFRVKSPVQNQEVIVHIRVIARIQSLFIKKWGVSCDATSEQGDIHIPIDESGALKLCVVLEGGEVSEWQAGEKNSALVLTPTWSLQDIEGADNRDVIQISAGGYIVPQKIGQATVSVAIGSEMKDPLDNTYISIVPPAAINIQIDPAFLINGVGNPALWKEFSHVFSGESKNIMVSGLSENESVNIQMKQNNSGARLLFNNIAVDSLVLKNNESFVFEAGTKTEVIDVLDMSKIVTHVGVDTLKETYELGMSVDGVVIEEFFLHSIIGLVSVDTNVPLVLSYRLSYEEIVREYKTLEGSLPLALGELKWESSNTGVIAIQNGVARAIGEGISKISVESSAGIATDTWVKVSPMRPEIDFYKVSPSFVSPSGIITVEADIMYELGVENIESVKIVFATSSGLPEKTLLTEREYWTKKGQVYSGDEELFEKRKYMYDYQLTGDSSLQGVIPYTLQVVSKDGGRSVVTGTITFGSPQDICTNDTKLLCLIRGLKCLREKKAGNISSSCHELIPVFNPNKQAFTLIDVLGLYNQL